MDLGIYACSWRPEGFGVPGAERRKKEKPQGRGREGKKYKSFGMLILLPERSLSNI